MLIVIVAFALAALGWAVLRGPARRSGGGARGLKLDEALRALAEAAELRFEPRSSDGSPCTVSGSENGVAFRIEPGTRGMLFDGDVAIVATCPSALGRVVVWPREPPDAVIEGLGQERSTGDAVFDARFAVFSSSAAAMLVLSDPTLRRAFHDLGIVALVIQDDDEAVLLLPGVPDRDALGSATALLACVVTRCRRAGDRPVGVFIS